MLLITIINTSNNKKTDVDLSKLNILLIRSIGTGKTLLVQILARIIDVPFTNAEVTTLTEAGYVGRCRKYHPKITDIDEIDKISKKNNNLSITRDVSGEV